MVGFKRLLPLPVAPWRALDAFMFGQGYLSASCDRMANATYDRCIATELISMHSLHIPSAAERCAVQGQCLHKARQEVETDSNVWATPSEQLEVPTPELQAIAQFLPEEVGGRQCSGPGLCLRDVRERYEGARASFTSSEVMACPGACLRNGHT